MKNLIPHFIVKQYEQGKQDGSFQAASLFVDISGFTKTTEALMQHGQEGAEMLADVMLAVFNPLVESVYAQGGFITGFAGDAFTALFLDPNARLEQALAAALGIQQEMASHPIQSTPVATFSFAAKVGVAEGHVTWGILYPKGPFDRLRDTLSQAPPSHSAPFGHDNHPHVTASYYFSGPAIDDCAGAEHHAQSGDLILTGAVYEALRSLLTADPVADHFRLTAVQASLPAPQPINLPLTSSLSTSLESKQLAAFLPAAIREQSTRGEFRHVLTVFLQLKELNDVTQLNSFVQAIFDGQHKYGGFLNTIDFGDKGCNMLLFWGMPISFENDIERALNFVLALSKMTPITFRAGITYRLMYAGLVGAALRQDYSCYGRGVNLAARHMIAAPWGALWLDKEVAKRAKSLFVLSFEGDFAFKGFAHKLPVSRLIRRKQATEIFYFGQMVGRQAELARLAKFVQAILPPEDANSPTSGHFAGLMLIQGEAGIGKSRLVQTLKESPALTREGMTPRWFLCQTDQILHQSLNPFRYWLRHYFSLNKDNDSENKQELTNKLTDLINATSDPTLQEELERTSSLLGALVDLHWPNSLYEQLEPELRFNNTLEALKNLIKAESLRQPVIIQLEDVHWLDADSVQFIQHLTRHLDNYPIAIIATARPSSARGREASPPKLGGIEGGRAMGRGCASCGDGNDNDNGNGTEEAETITAEGGGESRGNPLRLPSVKGEASGGVGEAPRGERAKEGEGPPPQSWGGLRGGGAAIFGEEVKSEEIILTGLSSASLGELANEVLGGPAAPALVKLLAERADGNPFFAEQLLFYLREQGGLSKTEAGFIPIASTEAQLPTDVRALLIARLDRLTQEVKATVQTAAVLGREFEVRLLAEMLRNGQIMSKVTRAEEAAIWSTLSKWHYIFKHALLRDTAYDMQLRAQLSQLHHFAAQAIESLYATDLTPHYGKLTYHYGQAQKVPQERHYAKLAGKQAVAQYANEEAIRYFSRALKLTPASDLEARYDLLLAREGVYDWQGKRPAQAQDLAILSDLVSNLDDSVPAGIAKHAAVSLRQANYGLVTGDYASSLLAVQQVIALAKRSQDVATEAEAHHLWGLILRKQGNYEDSQQFSQQALTLAQASHHQRVEADSLLDLGGTNFYLGNYNTAKQYFTNASQIYQTIGDQKGESGSLMSLGLVHTHIGNYLAGREKYKEALAVSHKIGYRMGETFILGNLGVNYGEVGEYKAARECQEQTLKICQEIGDGEGESFALCNLTLIHYNLRNLEIARHTSSQALAIHRQLGDRRSEAYTLTYLGHTLADSNQWQLAKEAYQKAIEIRRELGADKLIMDDLAGLAHIAMREGNNAQAITQVEEILAWIESNGAEGIEYPLQVYLTCYQVLEANSDNDPTASARADTILVKAHTLLEEQAAKIKDEALRHNFLENVSFNRELRRLWDASNG